MTPTHVTSNGTHGPLLVREADLSTPAYVCPMPTHRRCACVRPAYAEPTSLTALPCPEAGCGAVFLTFTELSGHHLEMHPWPDPVGLTGSDRGVQPREEITDGD